MVWMQWFCKVVLTERLYSKTSQRLRLNWRTLPMESSYATSGEHTGEMGSWSHGFGSRSCQDRSSLEHTVSLLFPQTLPDTVFTEIKEEKNWKARIKKGENWVDTTTTKRRLSLEWTTGRKGVIGIMQLLKTSKHVTCKTWKVHNTSYALMGVRMYTVVIHTLKTAGKLGVRK